MSESGPGSSPLSLPPTSEGRLEDVHESMEDSHQSAELSEGAIFVNSDNLISSWQDISVNTIGNKEDILVLPDHVYVDPDDRNRHNIHTFVLRIPKMLLMFCLI